MGQMRLYEKIEPAPAPVPVANVNANGEGAVSYDRLRISSTTPCHCGEEAKYLLDESQVANNQFHTSKWNAKSSGRVTLEINVVGPPILLSHYALKSANDFPGRDPRVWKLVAVNLDN